MTRSRTGAKSKFQRFEFEASLIVASTCRHRHFSLNFLLACKCPRNVACSLRLSWLSSTGGGGAGGAQPEAVPPFETFIPHPEICSENNRKISITKEICITIDFVPLKKFLEETPVKDKTRSLSQTEFLFLVVHRYLRTTLGSSKPITAAI